MFCIYRGWTHNLVRSSGEGGKSFFLVEIMPVLNDVTEERKETGRHPRPRCKGTERRDIQETRIVTVAGTWTGK